MKVKKVFKKIAALGLGATMVGATLFGASAATLADYPKVLSKNNQWNALFVVGENADSIDTIGLTNVISGVEKTALGYQTTTTTSTSAEGVEGVDPIETAGEKFNLGDDIQDIVDVLDETDEGMENVLKYETFRDSEGENKEDIEYAQELQFVTGTGSLMYTQDDDDAPTAGPYLYFSDDLSAEPAYTYVLEFDDSVEFDITSSTTISEDLRSTTIVIQGQKYTITDVKTTANVLDEVTLMAGETVQWMTQGDKVTKTVGGVEHEITMVDVTDDDQASCGFDIDGTNVWIDVDETRTVNGVTLGVTDAKTVHNEKQDADICEVNIGATELTLVDGDTVDKDGKEIEGSLVTIDGTAGNWDGITITWAPDEETYLAPGKELLDPVFGNFKFVFGGVNVETEQMSLTASGTDGEFTFLNPEEMEVVIPFYLDETANNVTIGDGPDLDDKMFITGLTDYDTCYFENAGGDNFDVCKGTQFVVMDGDTVAHVIEITKISKSTDVALEVSFEDITTGVTEDDVTFTSNGAPIAVSIAGISGTLTFEADITGVGNEYVRLSSVEDFVGSAETQYGAVISDLAITQAQADAVWIEVTENDDAETANAVIELSLNLDAVIATAEEFEVSAPAAPATPAFAAIDSKEDSDDKVYATEYGTTIEYDSDNKDAAVMHHPEEELTGNVYVAPTGAAKTTTSTSGTAIKASVAPTARILDSEVTNWKAQNIVSIGGPCANSVSAHILGDPAPCYAGFETGKALLKMVQNGDNVAILVAGGSGADTKLLSQILFDYDKYDLSGMDMVATTVSSSSLSIKEGMMKAE